jgi:UDP-N-acetyl-D-mannosaminuronate dehydrogenase
VLGLDVDSDKVAALKQGRSYIKHISADTVAEQVKAQQILTARSLMYQSWSVV